MAGIQQSMTKSWSALARIIITVYIEIDPLNGMSKNAHKLQKNRRRPRYTGDTAERDQKSIKSEEYHDECSN